MSVDPKFVELTADVLDFFFLINSAIAFATVGPYRGYKSVTPQSG